MNENDIDITDAVPTLEPSTRSTVKKVVFLGVLAAGALLLIDDQVKKFKDRKTVTVSVADSSDN